VAEGGYCWLDMAAGAGEVTAAQLDVAASVREVVDAAGRGFSP
jgi:hypothetical protein